MEISSEVERGLDCWAAEFQRQNQEALTLLESIRPALSFRAGRIEPFIATGQVAAGRTTEAGVVGLGYEVAFRGATVRAEFANEKAMLRSLQALAALLLAEDRPEVTLERIAREVTPGASSVRLDMGGGA